MAPRTFPFPLRIGTDICQISRIHRIISSPSARRFMMRVLAPGEQRPPQILEALRAVETQQTEGQEVLMNKCATWMAGRWAAKEAVIKAHKRKLFMHDIRIAQNDPSSDQNQPPVALLRHQYEDRLEDRPSVVQLSISHDGDYAMATCLAYDPWAKDDWVKRWNRMGASNTKRYHQNLDTKYKGKGVNKWYDKFDASGETGERTREKHQRPERKRDTGRVSHESRDGEEST